MTSKKKIGIIIAVATVLVITAVVGIVFGVSQNSNNEPTTPTLPTLPSGNNTPVDNTPPYNLSDRDYGFVLITKQGTLNFDEYNVTVPNTNEGEFAVQIDVNDVITFTLGKQSPTFDVAQLNVFAVAHEDMKNPYTTPVSEYENVVFSSNFSQKGDVYIAQAMIGYDTGVNEVLDIMVVYKGNIVAYSMFKVVDRDIYNKSYWENQMPEANICEFTIVTTDNTYVCYYDANTVTTLLDWTHSMTNIYGFIRDITNVTNIDKTWMITSAFADAPLTDGQVFTAEAYREPTVDFVFEVDNPEYLVYWLGKTQAEVATKFGTPTNVESNPTGTRLEYDALEIFLVDGVVVQINIKQPVYEPINALPNEPCNGIVFAEICIRADIELPDYNTEYFEDLDFFVKTLAFKQDNWTVEYRWESDRNFNPDITPFNSVVVYSGEFPLF